MAAKEYRPGWPQGITLAAQSMFPTMGSVMLVPVVPLLIQQFGSVPGSRYLIPTLLTAPALCIALLAPLMGFIGDRFGRRRPLMVALSFYSVAGVLPAFLSDLGAIFASRVLLGICEAAIITLSATMIGDTFAGQERARWLAAVSTVASVSAICIFGISGVLGSIFGWRGPFFAYSLSIFFLPAMFFLVREVKVADHLDRASEPTQPFPWRHVLTTAAVTSLGGVMFYTLVIQQGLALSSLGVKDPARMGMLTAGASLGAPLGTLVFMRIVRLGALRLLALAFAIIGIADVTIGSVQSDVQFAFASAVGQFGAGLLLPTLITWTLSQVPPSYRGRGTGIFHSMLTFSQFSSGLLVPFLSLHMTGSVIRTFAFIGVFALIAALIALIASRRRADMVA